MAGSQTKESVEKAGTSASKPASLVSILSSEQAGQLQLATKRFNSSPLLLARRFAPMAWYGLCGLLCIISILLSAMAGISLIGEGAKSVASQASIAMQSTVSAEASELAVPAANLSAVPPVVSKAGQLFVSMVHRLKTGLGYALVLLIAPIAAIVFAGLEGRSPMARRWRASCR